MNWTDDTTMKWTYLQRRYSNELNMIFWLYLWVCCDTREQWTVFQKCSFLSNFHSSSGVSVMTHISRFWGSSRDFEERTSNHEKNQVKVPMCAKPDLPAWAGPKASQAEWAGYVLQVLLTAAAAYKKEALKQNSNQNLVSRLQKAHNELNASTAQSLC